MSYIKHKCLWTCPDSSSACAKSHPGLCSKLTYSIESNDSVSGQWWSRSDWADTQIDLGPRCPHMPGDTFSLAVHIKIACRFRTVPQHVKRWTSIRIRLEIIGLVRISAPCIDYLYISLNFLLPISFQSSGRQNNYIRFFYCIIIILIIIIKTNITGMNFIFVDFIDV